MIRRASERAELGAAASLRRTLLAPTLRLLAPGRTYDISPDGKRALIDGKATIKQLQRGPGYWTLKPHSTNLNHQPIVVGSEFRMLGVVQRVLKKGSDVLKLVEE